MTACENLRMARQSVLDIPESMKAELAEWNNGKGNPCVALKLNRKEIGSQLKRS